MVNSRLGLSSAACLSSAFLHFTDYRLSFSRSYGYILPSSLTRVFPRTLEFSSCLPVSVSVRVHPFSLEAFLGNIVPAASSLLSPEAPHHISALWNGLPVSPTYLLDVLFQSHALSFLRHSVARTNGCSTGISTCCPSPTRLRLGLGPDLPWDDERCPGTLRLSVERILTFLFATHTGILSSCLSTAPSGTASPMQERSPTHVLSYMPKLRFRTSAPVIFGAESLDQ